jgi:hypothetical protein
MQTNEQKNIDDWRDEVFTDSLETLKIADGEVVEVVFLSEGEKRTHADYGTSVIFRVEVNQVEKNWYVNANNFDLLKQLKDIGNLTGKVIRIKRTGSKKSDTRYNIEEIQKDA